MVALSTLSPGFEGTVAELRTTNSVVLNKLFAMGIYPGAPIVLEQCFPSYVVRLGRTRAALDREIAQHIHVLIDVVSDK